MKYTSRDAWPPSTYGSLVGVFRAAVQETASKLSGVDPHAEGLTDAQRKELALAEVHVWREMRGAFTRLTNDAVETAAWFGASGPQVARVAGLGAGNQANKQWPRIGETKRARKWMRERGGELIAVLVAFFALVDRMNLPEHHSRYALQFTAAKLADGDYDRDRMQLWELARLELQLWAHAARPDENDQEACGALRRLRDLIDDLTKTTEGSRDGQAEG